MKYVSTRGSAPELTFEEAMMTGLADQQISNDPGGDRWSLLVDRAVGMLLTDSSKHTHTESEQE